MARGRWASWLAAALSACGSDGSDAVRPAPLPSCRPGEERSCYAGPAGSEGVGACRAGTQTCLEHGRGWGPCAGEILPEHDDCAGADANCDGIDTCGDTLWSARFGGEADEAAVDLDADAAGNVYLTGSHRAPFDLGGAPLAAPTDTRHVFVAKLSARGEHLWSRAIHGAEHFTARGVAVAPGGRVAVVASLRGEIQLDGGPTLTGAGGNDAGFVIYSSEGLPEAGWVVGDGNHQNPIDLAFDARGDLLATGFFRGEMDFGAGALGAFDSQYDVFVVKLSPSGEARWSRSLAGSGDDLAHALAVDRSDGSVYVAGDARYDLRLGDRSTVAGGDRDVFVAKLDAEGEPAWLRRWGDEQDQEAYGLAVDRHGDIVVVGGFHGRMELGAALLESPGGGAVFVAKLAPDGEPRWARALAGSGNQLAYRVAVDSRDRIVLSGYYEGYVDFDGTVLPESGIGEPNILITKLEPDGTHLWSRGVMVQGEQSTPGALRAWRGVAIDESDGLLLAGYALGELDLGLGALEPLGGSDVLVARLAP